MGIAFDRQRLIQRVLIHSITILICFAFISPMASAQLGNHQSLKGLVGDTAYKLDRGKFEIDGISFPFSLAEFETLTVHWGYARELQLSTRIFRNVTQGPNITAKFRVASLIRERIDIAVPISFSMRFAPFRVDFITGASFSKASSGRFAYHGGFRLFASTSDTFGISSIYGIASYRVHAARSIMAEIDIAPLNDQFLALRVGEMRRFGPAEVRVAVHLLLPIVSNHANINILVRF